MRKCLEIAMIAVVIAYVSSCRTTESRWQEATRINTVDAYREFLQESPDSRFAEESRARIDDLRFAEAKSTGTIEAYEQFLRNCHRIENRKAAEEGIRQMRFRAATESNTLKEYDEFLKRYPVGDLSGKIKACAQSLLLEQIHSARTATACEDLLKRYTWAADLQDEVQKRICTIRFEEAKSQHTLDAYKEFVKQYPKSDLAEQVKSLARPLYKQAAAREDSFPVYFEFLQWYREGEDVQWARERAQATMKPFCDKVADVMMKRWSRDLANAVQRSAPTTSLMLNNFQTTGTKKVRSPTAEQDIKMIEKLLRLGADPNAFGICDFEPAERKVLDGGKAELHSSGSAGRVVEMASAPAGTISLLEFARRNDLEEVVGLLRRHGGTSTGSSRAELSASIEGQFMVGASPEIRAALGVVGGETPFRWDKVEEAPAITDIRTRHFSENVFSFDYPTTWIRFTEEEIKSLSQALEPQFRQQFSTYYATAGYDSVVAHVCGVKTSDQSIACVGVLMRIPPHVDFIDSIFTKNTKEKEVISNEKGEIDGTPVVKSELMQTNGERHITVVYHFREAKSYGGIFMIMMKPAAGENARRDVSRVLSSLKLSSPPKE